VQHGGVQGLSGCGQVVSVLSLEWHVLGSLLHTMGCSGGHRTAHREERQADNGQN
jgi:hypothetical protein